MIKLSDFFEEKIGYIPFDLDGEIKCHENFADIYLSSNCSEKMEIYVKKFFQRVLKKSVNIVFVGNQGIDFLINNWNNLIKGNALEDFLMLVLPEKRNDQIIFKTASNYVQKRLNDSKIIFENFLKRYLGFNFSYRVELDKTLSSDIQNDEVYYSAVSSNNFSNSNASEKGSDVILGKIVKKIPIPMNRIAYTEGAFIVVEGEVFHSEYNDRAKICSLFLTDDTDSIIVKHFDQAGEKIFNSVSVGDFILVEGSLFFDTYINDFVLKPFNLIKGKKKESKMDSYEEKRVELHSHSKLSQMDALIDVKTLVSTAASWGHKAIAITDHASIQNVPEFYDVSKSKGIKPIFGFEAYVVDDFINIIEIFGDDKGLKDCTFVVLDFETTGLQPNVDEIIEIGAVKLRDGEILEKFHQLIKPKIKLPEITTRITGITEDMLEGMPSIEDCLGDFLSFAEGCVLVAHNADFDYRFLRAWVKKVTGEDFENTYIDTLSLSKSLLNLSSYSLDKVVKHLKLGDFDHHRADEDAQVTALVFNRLIEMAKNRNVSSLYELNNLKKFIDFKSIRPTHMTILVKNRIGLKNAYKLVSNSHVKYFYRLPRVLKSELIALRDGLIIGSGCENGELAQSFVRGATKSELIDIAKFYDFIEIMPIDTLEFYEDVDDERAIDMYKLLYEISVELGIIPVMTGNVHYLNNNESKFRDALKIADKKKVIKSNRYFRTTEDMMQDCMYIFNDKDICYDLVIKNTNLIADSIEDIKPLKKTLNPPKIDNSDVQVREITMQKAYEVYGDPLPDIVVKRLDKELNSIINHGYAVLYLMAEKIVKKSNEDGYLVGSRGSVGSSLVATLMGITEVNPLPPHYVCPECKVSIFIEDGSCFSGYDLPDKKCEKCSVDMIKNGQDIPFETFMGFEGDKVPDIDLNFAGEYQNTAHKYVEEMFGEDHVFRAGTISTVAERTAMEYARKYFEFAKIPMKNSEIIRFSRYITGVKRTAGQHPGGLMIVPKEFEIYDFSPIQFPANDSKSGVKTTHFDYHVIHDDLVKLDALGHDDPTFIKMLKDLTGIDSSDVPMDDKDTMSLFSSSYILKVDTKNELGSSVGSFGIPEFGTDFVRRMLEDTRPKTFAELVRISGLSHGTLVWNGNAKDLIDKKIATLKDVIACRDDIMNYLIHKGMEQKKAFFIMEKVRKGKGLSEEEEKEMKLVKVPEWFIESCKLIKYLFPKAHAAAYVSMGVRIAWFKVHKPLAFYATYFSIKGDEFNLEVALKGKETIKKRLLELRNGDMDVKKKSEKTVMEIALEMLLRGFAFKNVDLYKSDSKKFIIDGNSLIVPFLKVPNLGIKAAESIVEERKKSDFHSIEDLLSRTALNKTNIETLKAFNILKGIPEINQMSLFGG